MPHVQRVNYKVSCYKKAYILIFERPRQGWVREETNIIETLWVKESILPQSVVHLLDTDNNDKGDTDDETEPEVPSDYVADDDKMEDS